jgi:hypothetical protein
MRLIYRAVQSGITHGQIAKQYNVHPTTVRKIAVGHWDESLGRRSTMRDFGHKLSR